MYAAAEWMDRVRLPSEMDRDMRGFDGDVSPPRQFSCEIEVTEVPDELTVELVGR